MGIDSGPSSAVEKHLGTELEKVVPGVRVSGVVGQPVTIIDAKWVGSNFLQVTHRDDSGHTGQAMLRRDDEPRLRIYAAGPARAFDADPADWRLAAEALRIRYAALYDPMLAVATSDMDPLPHQLRAVYGELLPRTPLRFLLADDPGAGKTIMAGLYIKELLLRGDLERCLVVAPGGLVDQWQDELALKFGLSFDVLTRQAVDAMPSARELFDRHPLLIARMDQLSRSEELAVALSQTDWDLVVVDEAHRMSAHYFGNELKRTKRYELGMMLGGVARHLLLMTATPHSGKPEDFQLFLALLDGDRFEGKFRDGVHTVSPEDLMRRMVKEELLTMEGKPLFPERRAYTVPYQLSEPEAELYEVVSEYVRNEMGRADRLDDKEGRRRNNVGFALTVLQRRLASSPEAILRSLERRKARLEKRMREIDNERFGVGGSLRTRLDDLVGRVSDPETLDDRLDDLDASEVEDLEEEVMDSATAARTQAELQAEIVVLDDLIVVARRVRVSGTDRKWSELRSILSEQEIVSGSGGVPRKLIVFTEHKDTLNYLVAEVSALVGDPGAVVAIHGGVTREARRAATEKFSGDPSVRVLVATDAAGEGLNLQRAHLMVNYDLPWNPNKIEQRFGRIHRIGQTETCHLWNLVAANTREGDVFVRLLEKVEQQREAYGGKVFDVLGEAFEGQPLRDLLIRAIRYGDLPEVRAHLDTVIDASVGEGIDRLVAERALHTDHLGAADTEAIARQLEEARARRLQPHYIRAFFLEAFKRLGGRILPREGGRYEVANVPARVRERDRQAGVGAPVLQRYERVCFERDQMRRVGQATAQLLAPGHPLLDAVVDLVIEDLGPVLQQGTVLFDPNDMGDQPRLLVASTEEIIDGNERTVSKRFSFAELYPDASARVAGAAPYLDYEPLRDDTDGMIEKVMGQAWLADGAEDFAVEWAVEHTLAPHVGDVERAMKPRVAKTRAAVQARLRGEINHWDSEHARLLDYQAAGRKIRMSPATAERRARDLEDRLVRRMAALDRDEHLTIHPPVLRGSALVIPAGLLPVPDGTGAKPPVHARETELVERRAVDAVLASERALGAKPEEMPHSNPGFDIRSARADGSVVHIEVKGRIEGSDDFTITKNEVVMAKNFGDSYRLAMVMVGVDGPETDRVCYVTHPFDDTDTDDFTTTKYVKDWRKLWAAGAEPR